MKKTLIATAICTAVLSTSTQAADFYVEGQLGMARISDISTATVFSPETGTLTIFNKVDNSTIFGIEGGITNFEPADVLRLGISYQSADVDLDTSAISSIEGGSLVSAGSMVATTGDLDTLGNQLGEDLRFDQSVDIISANVYYDFSTDSAFKPYIGLGFSLIDYGWANDTESGLTYTLGANYQFTDQFSAGLKYQKTQAKSLTSGQLEIQDLRLAAWAAVVHFEF